DERDPEGHPEPGVQGCPEEDAGGAAEDGPPRHGGGAAAAPAAEQGHAAADPEEPRAAEATARGGADGSARPPRRRPEEPPGRVEPRARRAGREPEAERGAGEIRRAEVRSEVRAVARRADAEAEAGGRELARPGEGRARGGEDERAEGHEGTARRRGERVGAAGLGAAGGGRSRQRARRLTERTVAGTEGERESVEGLQLHARERPATAAGAGPAQPRRGAARVAGPGVAVARGAAEHRRPPAVTERDGRLADRPRRGRGTGGGLAVDAVAADAVPLQQGERGAGPRHAGAAAVGTRDGAGRTRARPEERARRVGVSERGGEGAARDRAVDVPAAGLGHRRPLGDAAPGRGGQAAGA